MEGDLSAVAPRLLLFHSASVTLASSDHWCSACLLGIKPFTICAALNGT